MSKPGTLLIYYGWPGSINGSTTVEEAVAEFDRYDYVVLGSGLEAPSHAQHEATAAIIRQTRARVFGYIDLGMTTFGWRMRKVKRRVRAWSRMGVFGIFYDDFGHDFGVTRRRQNIAINYAHSFAMPVIVNAWHPSHVFDGPRPSALGQGDGFLIESFHVHGGFYDLDWRVRAEQVAAYQARYGFEVFSITTTSPDNRYDEALWHETWWAAANYGHLAVGWGEYLYSANSLAPYRPRPLESP